MAFVDIQFNEETEETKKATERAEQSLEVLKWSARAAVVTGGIAIGVCLIKALTNND